MADIVLFHPVIGRVRGVVELGDRLTKAGHRVLVPDLFAGQVFDDNALAAAHFGRLGIMPCMKRAAESIQGWPSATIYAGFSLGAVIALRFAATKPGARGCLAIAGALPLPELKVDAWPATVPLQMHYAHGDPSLDRTCISRVEESVRAVGARYEYCGYDCAGHLFMLPGQPEHDPAQTELLYQRVSGFLGRCGQQGCAARTVTGL